MTNKNDIIVLDFENKNLDLKQKIPIYFQVNGQYMLGTDERDNSFNPWGTYVYIYEFAVTGFMSLTFSRIYGAWWQEILPGDKSLLMETSESITTIWSDFSGYRVQINYEYLFETWKKFVIRVKKSVTKQHPEMNYWSLWDILDDPYQYCYKKLEDTTKEGNDPLYFDTIEPTPFDYEEFWLQDD